MPANNPPEPYSFAVLVIESEVGYESMAELIKQHGVLPTTPTLKGPNGSIFYFFPIPPGTTRKNVSLAPHVTLRADGRYDDLLPPDILAQVEAAMRRKK
jgi:hypothetical protein